jgi:hypothetical protein
MRDFKGMKRQRGRNRGGGGSGNGKPTQNVNRAFDSNGPDGVKIRGHAQHVYDKYCQLARDAASAGDRVLAENYLQHAEHYFRVLRVLQPSRPASDITGRDVFASGFDIDVDEETDQDAAWVDEGGDVEADGQRDPIVREQTARDQTMRDQNRDGYARDNRDNRDNRERNQNRDRYEPRDRPRDDRPREDRPREDRPREDRPRQDDRYRDRGERRYTEPRGELRGDRADPLAVVEPQSTPLTSMPVTSIPVPATPLTPIAQTPLSAPIHRTPLSAPVRQTPLSPILAVEAEAPPLSEDGGEPAKRPRGRPRKRPVEDAAEPAE